MPEVQKEKTESSPAPFSEAVFRQLRLEGGKIFQRIGFEHPLFQGPMCLEIENELDANGEVNGYLIRIYHEGDVVAVFNVAKMENCWNLYHRKVKADYQDCGLFNLAYRIIETVVRQSQTPALFINPTEGSALLDFDKLGIENESLKVVQTDVMEIALCKGFEPMDERTRELIECVRQGIGFQAFMDPDSGEKAIPLTEKTVSLPLMKHLQ